MVAWSIDSLIDLWMVRLVDLLTDWLIDWQTDKLIDWSINKVLFFQSKSYSDMIIDTVNTRRDGGRQE